MLNYRNLVLVLCPLAALEMACRPCDSAGCSPPFLLDIRSSGEVLESATYEIRAQTEENEATVRCDIGDAVPQMACEAAAYEPSNNPYFTMEVQIGTDDGSPSSFLVLIDHVEGPEDAPVHKGPRTVEVVIRRDGQQVAEEVFAPMYQTYEYRGPGCGWCDEAPIHQLTLDH